MEQCNNNNNKSKLEPNVTNVGNHQCTFGWLMSPSFFFLSSQSQIASGCLEYSSAQLINTIRLNHTIIYTSIGIPNNANN